MPASLPRPPTLAEVCTLALRLPCSPVLLPRLIEALEKETSTAYEIERIISMDSALAASTLRAANSAFYGARGGVAALDEAIILLGEKEIYRIAALALIGRWGSVHTENLRWEPAEFTRHSMCTAVAAELLAEASGTVDPSVAYTAGLLCDLGKFALAYACAPFYPSVSACCKVTRCTWEQAEKLVLGYHHAEAAGRLLRAWNFPEQLSEVVEVQLSPAQAPQRALPLLAHLHAAKYLSISMGTGVSEESFLSALYGSFLREWGFTLEFLAAAMVEVRNRTVSRFDERLLFGPSAPPPG
jgi:HD-like signal output (HDOD) protein